MRRLALFAALVICVLAWGNASAKAEVLVTIDIPTQWMTVDVDNHRIYGGPVATARPGYVTHTGTFRPGAMYEHHRSNIYFVLDKRTGKRIGAPMNYATYYWGAEAIHYGSPDVLSHGCAHSQWAKKLFFLIKEHGRDHTLIVIH